VYRFTDSKENRKSRRHSFFRWRQPNKQFQRRQTNNSSCVNSFFDDHVSQGGGPVFPTVGFNKNDCPVPFNLSDFPSTSSATLPVVMCSRLALNRINRIPPVAKKIIRSRFFPDLTLEVTVSRKENSKFCLKLDLEQSRKVCVIAVYDLVNNLCCYELCYVLTSLILSMMSATQTPPAASTASLMIMRVREVDLQFLRLDLINYIALLQCPIVLTFHQRHLQHAVTSCV